MQNSFFFDSYNYGEDLNAETDTGSVSQLFIHSAMVELYIIRTVVRISRNGSDA